MEAFEQLKKSNQMMLNILDQCPRCSQIIKYKQFYNGSAFTKNAETQDDLIKPIMDKINVENDQLKVDLSDMRGKL